MFKENLNKFLRFGAVGVCAFLIDWGVFNFLFQITKYFLFSLGFAWVLSLTFNFIINRNYTFSAQKDPAGKQLLRWLLLHAIAFSARAGIGKGILEILGGGTVNANIAFVSGLIVSIPITFLGSMFWVFKKRAIIRK